ncbi:variable surface protein [Plasmodium gonderi]|uniref:Variable surface protein n=1 Tax=Plasmodium gonderi TaxID=77519 RepID=A0A1Y1JPS4_PLAGO|nr:variable surface protein [Plasmodium gonderi]GAW84220.1 variable surface protein [Plasmodium gonderi]
MLIVHFLIIYACFIIDMNIYIIKQRYCHYIKILFFFMCSLFFSQYKLVKYFREHNDNLEKNHSILNLDYKHCLPSGSIGANKYINGKFSEDKCKKALLFASKIKADYNSDDAYSKADCFYLYYWLYKEFKSNGISQHTQSFYTKLFNIVSSNNGNNICNYYKNKPISENVFKDVSNLYEMYNNLYYINNPNVPSVKSKCDCINECSAKYEINLKKCESNNNSTFCTVLEDIKNEYNNIQNLTDICNNVECKKLPCRKNDSIQLYIPRNSKSKTSIISTIIILIIPALLFIIYKVKCDFLPYNSCIRREIKRIINKCRRLKEQCNISENSEIYNNIYWNSNYNVLYSSHSIND